MLGGLVMSYKHIKTPAIVRLSGETGRKVFESAIKGRNIKFNPKAASRKAHKELRRQGFFM